MLVEEGHVFLCDAERAAHEREQEDQGYHPAVREGRVLHEPHPDCECCYSPEPRSNPSLKASAAEVADHV